MKQEIKRDSGLGHRITGRIAIRLNGEERIADCTLCTSQGFSRMTIPDLDIEFVVASNFISDSILLSELRSRRLHEEGHM